MVHTQGVTGSNPVAATILPLKLWPVGQVVKTPPFHGGIMGSNPVRVTKSYARKQRNIAVSEFFILLKIDDGTYLGLMLSSRTVPCLDADYLRTVDVTFITIV